MDYDTYVRFYGWSGTRGDYEIHQRRRTAASLGVPTCGDGNGHHYLYLGDGCFLDPDYHDEETLRRLASDYHSKNRW